MIWELDRLRFGNIPPIVIIGSGPAGVTLSVRLSELGLDSLVLEAGGEHPSAESQEYYAGEVIGDTYYDLDTARIRAFGGSSQHWAGNCRTLDRQDFERRDHIPNSGWPISYGDLHPFFERAAEILEAKPYNDRVISDSLVYAPRSLSPAVNFADKYGEFFQSSARSHLVLNAAVYALHAKDGAISAIELRHAGGESLRLEPETVVLCTGGIENSRLLLWSNAVSDEPVVSDVATLGRYWMERPRAFLGNIAADGLTWLGPVQDHEKPAVGASKAAMAKYGIANGSLLFGKVVRGWDWKAASVFREVACTLPSIGAMVSEAAGKTMTCDTLVHAEWEQAPDSANRIVLSRQRRDRNGVPLTELHWRKTSFDYRTVKVLFELLGVHVVDKLSGRAHAMDWVIDGRNFENDDFPAVWHHMGGTRMASSSSEGVLDANLRIFGMRNAYVLGSSVFPTAGSANPTMTIVMLALRLADHLKRIG